MGDLARVAAIVGLQVRACLVQEQNVIYAKLHWEPAAIVLAEHNKLLRWLAAISALYLDCVGDAELRPRVLRVLNYACRHNDTSDHRLATPELGRNRIVPEQACRVERWRCRDEQQNGERFDSHVRLTPEVTGASPA